MKQVLYLLVFLSSSSLFSQEFEGVITYKTEYPINHTDLSEQELQEMLGSHATTYFKNGFYKEIGDSKFMNYQLYKHTDSMIYYKNNIKSDTLFYKKTYSKIKEDFSYDIEKKSDTILGYICDKLIVKNEYGTYKYYYTEELSLKADNYKNFTIGSKDKIVELMKAVYLRLEIVYQAFSVDIIATKVERKELEKLIFEIPEHKVLIEN